MREATRETARPTLNTKETQCSICGRLFSSDSACEITKPYRKPVTVECKDPASLGMECRERADGFCVWYVPLDPEIRERLEKMWSARRKKVT